MLYWDLRYQNTHILNLFHHQLHLAILKQRTNPQEILMDLNIRWKMQC